jgi:hypothetical protein
MGSPTLVGRGRTADRRFAPSKDSGGSSRADSLHAQIDSLDCGNSYGWFTEGFDTADLKDAKSLLNGLNE